MTTSTSSYTDLDFGLLISLRHSGDLKRLTKDRQKDESSEGDGRDHHDNLGTVLIRSPTVDLNIFSFIH
jgi:hypothetical protein